MVVGASTGTDAHTVGIDAIMNRKGFAGHYGLERYEMIEAYNLGSQVPNEDFLQQGRWRCNADVLLVSQTVTQKDVHIQNLTELIELAEAEGRAATSTIVCCGGAAHHARAGQGAGLRRGLRRRHVRRRRRLLRRDRDGQARHEIRHPMDGEGCGAPLPSSSAPQPPCPEEKFPSGLPVSIEIVLLHDSILCKSRSHPTSPLIKMSRRKRNGKKTCTDCR